MMPMAGLRPEQGPPLTVPLSFFFTAPLALLFAGGLLLARGDDGTGSQWGATSLAVAHLGAVGFLLFVMLGAMYQMLPVVAGAVVPRVRLAHGVHGLLVGGAASLVYGQATSTPGAFTAAAVLLTSAVLMFLVPATVAVARQGATGPTPRGLTLALLGLGAVVFAGVRLALVRGGLGSEAFWASLRAAHVHLGFLMWLGVLIASVSWQVLPMFFLAPEPSAATTGLSQLLASLSLVGLLVALVGVPSGTVAWLALPGAVAAWLLHPAWAVRALRARKRRRRDATLWFWWLGLASAPACLLLGAAAAWLDDERWALTYGLVVLWGWAGAIVHGMLTRIVPFLVWLHRCAPLVGRVRVPSAKELLPDRSVAVGFALHLAALLAGLGACWVGTALAWRAFGSGLFATGAWLLVILVRARFRGGPR